MYSFDQRSDTRVFDEPFYAHYLLKTGKDHPGREEIIESQSGNADDVLDMIASTPAEVLYVKNMAHHMRVLPVQLLDGFKQLILIRDPARLITSFAKVIENPDMGDIGLEDQLRMWKRFVDEGIDAPILDSGELLKNPSAVLIKLCESLGIPYDDRMLSWPAGANSADGVWAQFWYSTVHRSTDFSARSGAPDPLPERCKDLYNAALPLYEELFHHSIKAD